MSRKRKNPRLGNQNARTHGVYSQHPPNPDELRKHLQQEARNAIKCYDHLTLRRVAAAFKQTGDVEGAKCLRAMANHLQDEKARRAGLRTPIRRATIDLLTIKELLRVTLGDDVVSPMIPERKP